MSFYAVAKGHSIGIFLTWPECEKQTKGFPAARFKKFKTRDEAQQFIAINKKPGDAISSLQRLSSHDGRAKKVDSKIFRSKPYDRPSGSKKEIIILDSPPATGKLENAASGDAATGKNAIVYTDGACSNNGRKSAQAGIGVFWGIGDPRNVSEPLLGRATNNRAEIHAAVRAIKDAKSSGFESVTIKTDSQFMIDSMTKWLNGWKKRNWKLSTGGDVKNKEDFQELEKASEGIKVIWEKVAAHCGIAGNEAADRLAVEGANRTK